MFRCEICGRGYCLKSSLSRHKRTKHDGIYLKCEKCIRIFTSYHARDYHLEKEHGVKRGKVEKPYKCQDCEKEYAYLRDLQDHIIAEHTEETYPCIYCKLEYKSPRRLDKHVMRRHQNLAFNYDEKLKEGKSLVEYIEKKELPIETLEGEDMRAAQMYLDYKKKIQNMYK